jgi:multicomponent Na+:H+ antiporter subunit D
LSALFVARATIREEGSWLNFTSLMFVILAGMNGIVLVRDIFSLYIFLEITAVTSFILIAFDRDIFGLEGAFKYLILSGVATALLLSGIALFFILTGSTDFSLIAQGLKMSPNVILVRFGIALFLVGLFIKSGLMPFHGWLPDAYMAAPSPVSVLLAGIVTKTVGVYALMRVAHSVFGLDTSLKMILMVIGTVSIVLGAFAAMGQKNFKRMLAYSSISQVGYIILGFGCGTKLALIGAVFHLFNHAIFKSLLFVNAAAVESRTGTQDMDKMSGLAQHMPVTGTTSIIASLSAAGIPPLSGFWSKLMIIVALWMAGFHGYASVAVLASLVTLAYLLSMQRRIFFGVSESQDAGIKEAGLCFIGPSVLLAAIIVGVGLFFPIFLRIFNLPLGQVFGGMVH